MVELTYVPAELDLVIIRTKLTGDKGWQMLVDADIDLTGYSFSSVVEEADRSTTTILVTETDLSNGQVTLSLTVAELKAFARTNHKWYFEWSVSSVPRRVIVGDFTILDYL